MRRYQVKAIVQGPSLPPSRQLRPVSRTFAGRVIPHPFDMAWAEKRFRDTPHLAPPIRAIVSNVDLVGHQLLPVPDLEADDARRLVEDVLDAERWMELDDDPEDDDPGSSVPPTDREVDERLDSMSRRQRREKVVATTWIARWSPMISWLEFRKRRQLDLQKLGNSWLEIIRNPPKNGRLFGIVARLERLRAREMFWTWSDDVQTTMTRAIRVSPLRVERIQFSTYLRRAVQRIGSQDRYFKQFGDPRVVSSRTGEVFETVEELTAAESGVAPATEVVHFVEYDSSVEPYGLPPWWGSRRSLVGTEKADIANLDYFTNKPPAGALLVSGGNLKKGQAKRARTLWKARGKGLDKFNELLILEAEEQGPRSLANPGTSRTTIKFIEFGPGQRDESLFMDADRRTADKIGMMLGVSRFSRGDITDVNRATAQEARAESESGTYAPRRQSFDDFVSNELFPEIGVSLWVFSSRRPSTTSDLERGELVESALEVGAITPNEARAMYETIFRVTLPRLNDPRADQLGPPDSPTTLTGTQNAPPTQPATDSVPEPADE